MAIPTSVASVDPLWVHRDAIVVDGHCDTLGEVLQGVRRLHERSTTGHVDLPRLHEAGVTAQVFACFVPVDEYRRGAARHALQRLDAFHRALEEQPDPVHGLRLATNAADIRQAKATGQVAGILGLEGAEAIEGSLELLRCFYRLGVRVLGLTWNFRNEVADGVSEGAQARGLTPFGRQVVEECNRLGVLLDVSHLAATGLRDVLEASRHPVMASHSNAAALCDHPRNLTDKQIEAIAERGGVIGVTFVPSFLVHPGSAASLAHVLDHIEHLLRVAGVDHVMIGSDFDGTESTPHGLEDVTRYPAITAGLLARGHDELTVRKVLGLNFMRVFEQVTGG
ncbi:MAG: dipeptidase, partial [Anaerolineae bacterium]|nr:dipeptidase [Anaerolineae bacterium]